MLREFIREEMVYPQKAIKEQIEGIVIISFLVRKDGSTGDYKVSRSLSKETDEEALRICKFILWFPATDLGRPVDYVHEMEFRFDIKKYQNQVKSSGYDQIIYPYLPVDSGNEVITRCGTLMFVPILFIQAKISTSAILFPIILIILKQHSSKTFRASLS